MKRTLINIRNHLALSMLGAGCIFASAANAADEICTFKTNEAHYAGLASPAEPLSFKWRKSTGKVLGFKWLHGGVPWFPFYASPGFVAGDAFPGDYHLRVNLGITTAGYTTLREEIRGYINVNKSLPNATFAGVHEGTASAWIVAYGQLTCVKAP